MKEKPYIERSDQAIRLEDATPEMRDWLFDDEFNQRNDQEADRDEWFEKFSAMRGILKDCPHCLMCGRLHEVCDRDITCEQSRLYNMTDEEQREARLLQLLKEFEAAWEALWRSARDPQAFKAFHEDWTIEDMAEGDSCDPDWTPVEIAARRYIIARDFGEFDPQRADMIWKLRDGGAL